MIIGDKKIAIVLTGILEINEVFKRAQIIAEMQSAAWLDAGY